MFKKLFGKAKEVDKNIKIYAPLTGSMSKLKIFLIQCLRKNDGRRLWY